MSRPSIAEALAAETPSLMKIPGVVGTGEGARDGHPVFVVLVTRRTDALAALLPHAIGGFAVEIREVGEVKALHGR